MKKPPIPSILLSTLLLLLLCFDIANAHNHGHKHTHPQAHRHTLPPRTPKPKPNLPSCASLEKLNHTLTRISPILEKVLHLDTAGGTSNKHKHGLANGHGHSHSPSQFYGKNKNSTQDQTQRETRRAALRTRDDADAGIAGAMERSKKRVAAGMMRCQGGKVSLADGSGNATAKSLEGMRRRWVRKRGDAGGELGDDESESESDSSSSSSSDSDSDSDGDSDDDSGSDSEDEEEKDKGQCTLMDVLDNLVTTLECLLAFTGGVLDGVLDLVLNMLAGILDLVESSLD